MSDRIKLKVGDRVRLLGERWETDFNIPRWTVVTVTEMVNGQPWSSEHGVGSLVSKIGLPYPGFPIQKIEDDSNEQAAADARILGMVRAAYEDLMALRVPTMTMRLESVAALLHIADEYESLKRSLVEGGER